ncbi:MAG: FHA domain-containing protein, partial [Caldilineae bacterium]
MKLVVTNGTSSTEYPLLKHTVTLGSAPDADIQLPDPAVLPRHAVIWHSRGMYAIGTWDSQGEVLVNDKPAIPGQPLWPGDKITLGQTHLLFL